MILKVELVYRSKRAKPKKVVAKVIKTPQGYRLIDCGLCPLISTIRDQTANNGKEKFERYLFCKSD